MSYVDKSELKTTIDYLIILYAVSYQSDYNASLNILSLIRKLIAKL